MSLLLSDEQVLLLRMQAQRLEAGTRQRGDEPESVMQDIFAVQAQEFSSGLLSIRARSNSLNASVIREAIEIRPAITWTWCLRGTLHLIPSIDARWLVPFLGPGLAVANHRRFTQLGWDDERARTAIHLIREALVEREVLPRKDISFLLAENGFPFEGQATVHLLFRAAMESSICPAGERNGKPVYRLFKEWIGEPTPIEADEALNKLALKYIGAYGPAGPEDFASWSGLKIGKSREAWNMIENQLIPLRYSGRNGWMLKSSMDVLERLAHMQPVVRLLPRFDTYWMGYADRSLAIDPNYSSFIFPGGGIIHPSLVVNGRACGTWRATTKRNVVEITLIPFARLEKEVLNQIEVEVEDIGRFLEKPVIYSIESLASL